MVEYTVYDARNGCVLGRSMQPDMSYRSQRKAICSVGARPTDPYIECEVRMLSKEASQPIYPRYTHHG